MKFITAIFLLIFLILGCKERVSIATSPQIKKQDQPSQQKSRDTVTIEPIDTIYNLIQTDTPPEILIHAKPVYSASMIEDSISGSVHLKLCVGKNGMIKRYYIGNDLGHGTAEAIDVAIRKMKFTPARRESVRIAVWIDTTLNFKLPNIF